MAMKIVRYSLAVGSLMYVQVCTRPYISFVVGVDRLKMCVPICASTRVVSSSKVMSDEYCSHGD